jgi:hypothetical protein
MVKLIFSYLLGTEREFQPHLSRYRRLLETDQAWEGRGRRQGKALRRKDKRWVSGEKENKKQDKDKMRTTTKKTTRTKREQNQPKWIQESQVYWRAQSPTCSITTTNTIDDHARDSTLTAICKEFIVYAYYNGISTARLLLHFETNQVSRICCKTHRFHPLAPSLSSLWSTLFPIAIHQSKSSRRDLARRQNTATL